MLFRSQAVAVSTRCDGRGGTKVPGGRAFFLNFPGHVMCQQIKSETFLPASRSPHCTELNQPVTNVKRLWSPPLKSSARISSSSLSSTRPINPFCFSSHSPRNKEGAQQTEGKKKYTRDKLWRIFSLSNQIRPELPPFETNSSRPFFFSLATHSAPSTSGILFVRQHPALHPALYITATALEVDASRASQNRPWSG